MTKQIKISHIFEKGHNNRGWKMQDRFKFRCFGKSNAPYLIQGMHDIKSIEIGEKGYYGISFEGNWLSFVEKDQLELMQCTGLKDKNGKLIYEGNIVYKKGNKDHKGNKMFSTVVWCSMYAEFNISDENGLHRMPGNPNNVEIIGNIYENPELLEKE